MKHLLGYITRYKKSSRSADNSLTVSFMTQVWIHPEKPPKGLSKEKDYSCQVVYEGDCSQLYEDSEVFLEKVCAQLFTCLNSCSETPLLDESYYREIFEKRRHHYPAKLTLEEFIVYSTFMMEKLLTELRRKTIDTLCIEEALARYPYFGENTAEKIKKLKEIDLKVYEEEVSTDLS